MKLSQLVGRLEDLVPSCFAQTWDNVGLICGDPSQEVRRLLLAVDLSAAVLAETKRRRAQMILTHHPPIYQKIARLTAGSDQVGLIYKAIRAGLALYAMHTNLDAIEGGTNSALARMLGISADIRPLSLSPMGNSYKLVVFVPQESAESLRDALFSAGAGRIGHQHRYSDCSYCSEGVGTFHGDESTSPAVGRAGRREYVPELRLETIVPANVLPAVLSAMRIAHPYEEPAYDLIRLEALDDRVGMGRVGKLSRCVTAATLIKRIKTKLGIKNLRVAGPTNQKVEIAAVASGSLGDLLGEVYANGAQFLLTGELNHHKAAEAAANNLTVAVVGHWHSERPGMVGLAEQLKPTLKGVDVSLSNAEGAPIAIH